MKGTEAAGADRGPGSQKGTDREYIFCVFCLFIDEIHKTLLFCVVNIHIKRVKYEKDTVNEKLVDCNSRKNLLV